MTWFYGDGVGLGRFAGMLWPGAIVKVDRLSGGATFCEHGDAFRADDERVGQREETEVRVVAGAVIVVEVQGWNGNLISHYVQRTLRAAGTGGEQQCPAFRGGDGIGGFRQIAKPGSRELRQAAVAANQHGKPWLG